MRIFVCAGYLPYPPIGGGRADIWRRIEAFTKLGHSVMLCHQYDEKGPLSPRPTDFEAMDRLLTARFSYPIKRSVLRTVRQLLGMAWLPWHSAKAVPTGRDAHAADDAIARFGPELVWLEGPGPGEVAVGVSRKYSIPLTYRSHNVEHEYLKRQAAASPSLRNRIAWRLASIGVKRYQTRLMRESDYVADISLDDLEYWRSRGIEPIGWLPPLPELALTSRPPETIPSEILFVGGLRLPNNLAGLVWLIDEVLPILHRSRPELTLTIVGSAQGTALPQLEHRSAVSLHLDVPSVLPYLFGAQVLVNPVSIGSGVQLKMLDMLMTDAPLVTRSQGVRGLPQEFTDACHVADTAEGFADAILAALDEGTTPSDARVKVRRQFGIEAVAECLERVASAGDPTEPHQNPHSAR